MVNVKKIAVLCHALKAGGGISVGQNCVAALKRQMPAAEFWVSVPQGLNYIEFIGGERTHFEVFEQKNYLQHWIYENKTLPTKLKTWKPDVVVALGNRAIPYMVCPQLLLIHDSHLFYPVKYYSRESIKRKLLKSFQRWQMKRDLKRVDTLLLQTETAEKRVRERFDYTNKFVRIPNALSVRVLSEGQVKMPAVYEKSVNKRRLLYLTRYYPHKNIELLVELFERFKQQMRDVVLYITIDETQAPGAKSLLSRIIASGLDQQIVNLGPLEQEELAGYFMYADALVMPTTLESFSGTYLEAMAFSLPVLTSDLDFAHEICGDAALYFDPWDAESVKLALERFFDNEALQSTLVKNGKKRLHSLAWDWEKNGKLIKEAIMKLV